MTSEAVKVVARIIAQPNKVNEVKSILLTLVEYTCKEHGCVSYQLLQNQTDQSDFTFVEEWSSEAAIEAHFTTPHVQDALAKTAGLLAQDPDIRKYSIVA